MFQVTFNYFKHCWETTPISVQTYHKRFANVVVDDMTLESLFWTKAEAEAAALDKNVALFHDNEKRIQALQQQQSQLENRGIGAIVDAEKEVVKMETAPDSTIKVT